ncbi:MAG: ketoacyl-ACP synthase III [Bacteroidia bacterium]|nr:ketoacyl-ACP synthase III [Bacteroidia bacterium]
MQIKAISVYLPPTTLSNKNLAQQFNVTEEEIYKKTGVIERRHTPHDFNMEDMAYESAQKLLNQHPDYKNKIDALLLIGHGFSYKAPNTSAILQHRLNLSNKCYCLDIPHGCTGYIYGLSIAESLIKSGISTSVLLITSDTPSYVIPPDNLELLSIFGDAATSTIIISDKIDQKKNYNYTFFTYGKKFNALIVERSGQVNPPDCEYLQTSKLPYGTMKMDGTAVFLMSIKEVPPLIYETLEKNNLTINDIDYFVFHQANSFMLEVLRKKLKIPKEKFFNDIRYTGNTVSNSIPIALHQLISENKIQRGMKILLAGFGIGFMLGATVIEY